MLRLSKTQKILSSFCSICNKFIRSSVTKLDTMTENNEVNTMQSEKRSIDSETENDTKKLKIDSSLKIKKRNYAMLLGYLGKNYYGMQRNPGMHTIEEDLIKAMYKAELISSEAFETIQSINFQRAARTDKGVSAVRQVVSLKLPENPNKDIINANLPEDIRVFAISRVTKGFNSKSQCDARTYSYTLPTFAFAPENFEHFQQTTNFDNDTAEEMEAKIAKRKEELSYINGKPCHEYRIEKEAHKKLCELLKLYEGTHNFHNYTSKILPLDPRAKRFIMQSYAEEPFIINNAEFITLKLKGQSFILHQIRKMVAMMIGIMRNIVTKDSFDQSFEANKYDISRAPSLGLMLNYVHYDYYNKRYGSDGMHEPLDWADCEDEIKEFENKKILRHVFDSEIEEKSTLDWLVNLNTYSFGIRDPSRDNKDNNREDNKEGTVNAED